MFENMSAPAADYAEVARQSLEVERCALLVVDMQEKLLPPIFQKERLLHNSKLLIRAADVLKIPAIVSTQYAKGLGKTVPEVASLLPESAAIDKDRFSCFGTRRFCTLLKRRVPARAKHGPAAVGPLYVAFSSDIFDSLRAAELTARARGSREFAEPLLVKAGLPAELANALDDTSWDAELQAQTDPALSLTGRDVGTPIIQFQPPHGVAFFGPVISRLPGDFPARSQRAL